MDLSTETATAVRAGNPGALRGKADGASAGAPSAGGQAGVFSNGDFETFLKMLTTQIRNQDPLNPMEGSDFAVQLATFSGVEQQVLTNQLLAGMADAAFGGLGTLASWLGKEVRTTAPVAFDGSPLTLDIQPARGADAVTLVTLDANGREILREDIGAGTGEIDWAGKQGDGTPLPAGRYSFRIESLQGGKVIGTANAGAYARVTGAEMTAEGIRLTLPGGASTLESQVTALREAG